MGAAGAVVGHRHSLPGTSPCGFSDISTFQKRSLVLMETQTEGSDPTAADQQLQPTARGQGRRKRAFPTTTNFI